MVIPLTKLQARVLSQAERFNYIFAPRRFGKSTVAKSWCILQTKDPNPFGLLWWVAPTYRQAYSPFLSLLATYERAGLVVESQRAEMRMRLATGWRVEFRTAERPDNLRGEGVDRLVIDEGAFIADDTYQEAIRPTLADKQGHLLAIGTPAGRRGWMYNGWNRGVSGRPGYRSWRFTYEDAIFLTPEEIQEARETMSPRAFAQELGCEFLDGVGVVFEGCRSRRIRPEPNEPVGIGVDWAKKVDWTWFVAVGAKSGAILEAKRLPQGLSYPEQVQELINFAKPYMSSGFYLCHDQTGVGEAVADLLAAATYNGSRLFDTEFNCEGVIWSQKEKHQLVEEAVVDVNSKKLGFLPLGEGKQEYDTMIREFEDYTLTITKTGKIVYGAPEGRHDDAVSAAMLANRARRRMEQGTFDFAPRITLI
jgi:hypothetical protein